MSSLFLVIRQLGRVMQYYQVDTRMHCTQCDYLKSKVVSSALCRFSKTTLLEARYCHEFCLKHVKKFRKS